MSTADEALDKMAENARKLGLDYEPAQQEPTKVTELVDALISKYSDKLFDSVGPHDAAKFEEDCNRIKQALAEQPAQLPFGVGGGLVAIKTLLSRDPCVHANTAIQMIDAILTEQPARQEPVAFIKGRGWRNGNLEVIPAKMNQTFEIDQPLYTSPPAQRKPLTDEQITAIYNQVQKDWTNRYDRPVVFARAIEAKLRSKNEDRN